MLRTTTLLLLLAAFFGLTSSAIAAPTALDMEEAAGPLNEKSYEIIGCGCTPEEEEEEEEEADPA